MSIVWREHSERESAQDQLSRFGPLTPAVWIGAIAAGCTAFYWGCVGLLKLGMWIYSL